MRASEIDGSLAKPFQIDAIVKAITGHETWEFSPL